MVSIIVPSRNERYLAETVDDVLKKAEGEIEVIVVLEGYWPDPPLKEDPRVRIIHNETPLGLRLAVNNAVDVARGEFIFKLDAHCLVDQGFDLKLASECDGDWIVIPRRFSLEPEGYKIREGRPFIDYEYISFPYTDPLTAVRWGHKWHDRAAARAEILLDDNMAFQGSAYFVPRSHYLRIGGMDSAAYSHCMVLESEEIGNKTWLSGGQVKVNKRVWYAHWHKPKEIGRGYFLNRKPMRIARIFHHDFWMHNRWPGQTRPFKWLIDHFWPVPGWPSDWEDPKYEAAYKVRLGI